MHLNKSGLRAPLLALMGLLAACARAPAPPPVDAECGAPIPGAAPLLQPGVTLLLGEVHGTQEIATALGDLACRGARMGMPVRIGMEMDRRNDALFERFLGSDGSASARAALLADPLWNQEQVDGRASVAAVQLLERLRRLRQRGHDVRIQGLGRADVVEGNPEVKMADSVQELRAATPQALLLVLAGNNHTRIDKPFETGTTLVQRGVALVSLVVRHAGGTAWGCPVPCGVREWRGTDRGPSRFVELREVLVDEQRAFHGELYVGRITASPPGRTLSSGARE